MVREASDFLVLNSTGATASNDSRIPAPEGWIRAAQYWAWTVSCVGVVGNLLTIFTIIHQLYLGHLWRQRHRSLYHNGTGRLSGALVRPVLPLEGDTLILLHLSLCDFLYCAINLPLTALTYNYAFSDETPSRPFCTGAALFRYGSAFAEWMTLGLLATERCVDLGRSRAARFFRLRCTVFCLVAIWAGSITLQLAIVKSNFDYDPNTFKCDIVNKAAGMAFYAVETWVPCGLMLTGCFSIVCQLWKHMKKLKNAGMAEDITEKRCKDMVKSTILVLSLLLLFLVCVIPICVYNIKVIMEKDIDSYDVPLGIFIFMIYWIQYGVNYLVYAAINANYRRAYKQFIQAIGKALFKTKKENENEAKVYLTSSHPHLMASFSHVPPTLSHLHTVTAIPLHAYRISQERVLRSHSLHPDALHAYRWDVRGKRVRTLSSGSIHSWNSLSHWSGSLSSRCSVVTMETNLGTY
ncbi:protein trapped in endoderm-1-like [Penaeus japonicus]|uniref:protein trapped in endoderm-1-like n=1 Tax=Penaeus japonicus TaxID=27405 RepID=UPI001C7124E5|nr:protein trapped in endoderm-1-like [Penaeus japonicus]